MAASDANQSGPRIHPFFRPARPTNEPVSVPAAPDLSDSSSTGGARKKRKTVSSAETTKPAGKEPSRTVARKRKAAGAAPAGSAGPLLNLLKPQLAENTQNGLETTPPPPVVDDGLDGFEDAEGEIDDEMMGYYVPSLSSTRTPASFSPPADTTFGPLQSDGFAASATASSSNSTLPPTNSTPNSAPAHTPSTITADSAKPTKVLKFNMKTGTLGSPPKPKSKPFEPVELPKRGRPKRRLIAVMRYGSSAEEKHRIGLLIEQILSGPPSVNGSVRPTQPSQQLHPVQQLQPTQPAPASNSISKNKSTHPFFSKGGSTSAPAPAPAPAPTPAKKTLSMITPCSADRSAAKPASGFGSTGFGLKAKGVKVPGAQHPLFPPREMVHVRGLTPEETPIYLSNTKPSFASSTHSHLSLRKSKRQAISMPHAESVVTCLQRDLDVPGIIHALRTLNDDFAPVPKGLRVPLRHVETGRKVQARIRPQLRTPLAVASSKNKQQDDDASSSDDELGMLSRPGFRKRRADQPQSHPFISRLYEGLATGLSAYDRCTCESTAWAQKYAPQNTGEVLQTGREAHLLKDWLVALKVDAVHTGTDVGKAKSGGKLAGKKRRKKKKTKLDGFVVDSDSEVGGAYSPGSESESEQLAEWAPDVSGTKRSVVRTAEGRGRLRNAVVLSGGHGVGKTAAVYAAAREAGFEVFEINAASRRAGKDVVERTESTKAESSQKQSLILIEEADILYEEDKAFWATLTTLMAQSKRPFVFTCNDETLLPLHTLPLHAIFRLRAPPLDATLDALLLMAAAEGHVLQRPAVAALLASRGGGSDLRGAVADLQFWCQLGVGDVRGGFDWLLVRWPPGVDCDENGDTLRVVSEGVYEGGMGWVGETATKGEEVAVACWEEFGVDLYGHEGPKVEAGAEAGDTAMQIGDGIDASGDLRVDTHDKLLSLAAFEAAADDFSLADVLSLSAYSTGYQTLLDPTIPDMPVKRRDDFTLGRSLLEADPLTSYSALPLRMAAYIKARAQKSLLSSVDAPSVACDSATAHLKSVFSAAPPSPPIGRPDYSAAFDPIAASTAFVWAAHIDPSVFDRPMTVVAEDVAPYVRSIVYFDKQRRARSATTYAATGVTDADDWPKKMRATRAVRAGAAAQDYFAGCDVDGAAVLRTAGAQWPAVAYGLWEKDMGEYAARMKIEMEKRAAEDRQRKEEERQRKMEEERRREEAKVEEVVRTQAPETAPSQAHATGMAMQTQPFVPAPAPFMPMPMAVPMPMPMPMPMAMQPMSMPMPMPMQPMAPMPMQLQPMSMGLNMNMGFGMPMPMPMQMQMQTPMQMQMQMQAQMRHMQQQMQMNMHQLHASATATATATASGPASVHFSHQQHFVQHQQQQQHAQYSSQTFFSTSFSGPVGGQHQTQSQPQQPQVDAALDPALFDVGDTEMSG